MNPKMNIHYDPEGDFLEVRFGSQHPPITRKSVMTSSNEEMSERGK